MNPVPDAADLIIPPEAARLVGLEFMRRRRVAPIDLKGGRIALAMVDPTDLGALDDVRLLTGCETDPVAASPEAIASAIERHFFGASDRPFAAELALPEDGAADDARGGEPRVAGLVERLFELAVSLRASDIHLEPQRQGVFVRFRVDGVLRTVHEFPKSLQPALASRLKVMADMDIAERRLPQDGQINARVRGRAIDLRISALPAKYGEKIVIRVLDKSGVDLSLECLGFPPRLQSSFEDLIDRPQGLVLVTGPTGSGKTTTLYAVLNRLKSPIKNIVTLEDPVEYELLAGNSNEAGVTQVQVNAKIGLTFAAGLRATLRQDPDVIMVGEIRDKETAEIAMKSALTGHLVLSTLHTNDAVGALSRLSDIGIERFLVASTLTGVLAQRLVRLLCPHCKEPYRPPQRALERMFPGRPGLDKAVLHRPKGCPRCQGIGYWGRQGVFELLVVDEEIKSVIHSGGGAEEARKTAAAKGLKSLRESGLELVLKGLTTVEEVYRTTV